MRVVANPEVRVAHLVAVSQASREGVDPQRNLATLNAAMREVYQDHRRRGLDPYDPTKLRLDSPAAQLVLDLAVAVQDEGDPEKIRRLLKSLDRTHLEAALVAAVYAIDLDSPAAGAPLWPTGEPQAA
jgi:inactivated superfamily I helicase